MKTMESKERGSTGQDHGTAIKKGWQTMYVGDILRLEYGKPLEEADRKTDGLFPVYGANGEKNRTDKFYYDRPSIIVGRKGSAGELNLTEGKFWPLDVTYFVTFDEGQYDLKFLYNLLATLELPKLAKGVKPGINRNEVYSLIARVPPLPEQQRIVAILDEAFAGIATAKANAEKNLQNARAIFDSYLNEVFTKRGEGWVEKPLEAIATILSGYAFKSTDFSAKEVTKCIKITNVGVRKFIANADGYLPESFAAEYKRVSVKEGSIIIALTRTIISGGLKVAVVPEEYNGALLNQRVASVVANDRNINGAFLFAYLSTQAVVDYVKARVNTLMQPNLSITDLRSMPIPVPPHLEQDKITEQLDSLSAETQRLAAIYEHKLAALEALKKSLLHKAFSGDL